MVVKIVIWFVLTVLLPAYVPETKDPAEFGPAHDNPSTVVSRRPATFAETYRWADGLAIDVVQVDHGRLLASVPVDSPTARAGDPISEITIVVRNESRRMARVSVTARLRYGPHLTPAASYVASAGHADHSTTQILGPGEVSYPCTLGFVIPQDARDHVVLDLGIDNHQHDRAVFAGSLDAV